MKFVRDPNIVYSLMDFADEEEIEFSHDSVVPSSYSKGYKFYKGKVDGRTTLLTPEDIVRCEKEKTNG